MILGLALSLAASAVFVTRGLQAVPRRQVEEPVRAWMSGPYIARSYHLPPYVLYAALRLPATTRDRRPLIDIAGAQHRQVSAVLATHLICLILGANWPSYTSKPPLCWLHSTSAPISDGIY